MRGPTTTARRLRRAAVLAPLLAIAMQAAVWAGCPPVDLQRCEVLHEESRECTRARGALR